MYNSSIKLELAAIAGLIILFFQIRQKMEHLPWRMKAMHWIFITIFTLIGANGLRFLAPLLIRPSKLELLFLQSSHFHIPLFVMKMSVFIFGAASLLLYFITMHLGKLENGARAPKLFRCLAPFCGFLYPIMCLGALGIDQSTGSLMAGIALLVIGIVASSFYLRGPWKEHLEKPPTP